MPADQHADDLEQVKGIVKRAHRVDTFGRGRLEWSPVQVQKDRAVLLRLLRRVACARTVDESEAACHEIRAVLRKADEEVGRMSVVRRELGCGGHFVGAASCHWRRHTQVGRYRVSGIGNYYDHQGKRQTLGASNDSYFEVYVFRTTGSFADDSDGCGCMEVEDWGEIEGSRYSTAGAAQAGHEAFVEKYERIAGEEVARD